MIILPASDRQGIVTTSTVEITAGSKNILIEIQIGVLDINNIGKSFNLKMQVSPDGVKWDDECGIAWMADPTYIGKDTNKNPRFGFDPILYEGKLIRMVMNIPTALNVCCDIALS